MPIPDFQSTMLPLLRFAADGKEHSYHEAIDYISKLFRLTSSEVAELLPSGRDRIVDNRVRWARFHLGKAKLLESTSQGRFKITARGLETLQTNPPEIDMKYLERFPEYAEFRALRKTADEAVEVEDKEISKKTPEELLEIAHQTIKQDLMREVLIRVNETSPRFFEKLVIDLLVRMGYGGSRSDAGKAIGRSGDGGIDGTISEDKLGLDSVYIQAKKWQGIVGRPDIQKFVGALQPHMATKGIFITTSDFTDEAKDYVSRIPARIILINGERLAELMIEHNVGVSTSHIFEAKKVDTDYFSEE